jgi:DNA-binding response OmpR family regulator
VPPDQDAGPSRVTLLSIAPDLSLDVRTRVVTVGGRQAHLTATETRLLVELGRHRGLAVHRNTLIQSVWGLQVPVSSRRLQMAISRLRSKIGYERIATIHDWGYTLTTWNG